MLFQGYENHKGLNRYGMGLILEFTTGEKQQYNRANTHMLQNLILNFQIYH